MEEKNIIKIQKKFRKIFLHKKSQEISSVLSELFLTVCEDYDNKLNMYSYQNGKYLKALEGRHTSTVLVL